ncbi:unnamed protein product [Coffea canephora]|uniref:Uncharacterized protein n=1 Tax=Coffea canephora TaxID=49390 RepID=A0A068TTM0_COFCA|nr:unnamed protein product [Coffea canephora]
MKGSFGQTQLLLLTSNCSFHSLKDIKVHKLLQYYEWDLISNKEHGLYNVVHVFSGTSYAKNRMILCIL